MKKFILTVVLLFSVSMMGVVSWWFALKPAIEGNANFEESGQGSRYITIPVGGRDYVDVPIDAINTDLSESNQLTVWQFNDARIMRTGSSVSGKPYAGGVQYSSNKQVYKQFGDYYVTVTSPTKNVMVSAEGMQNVQVYTAPCPEMNELNQLGALPDTVLPTDYQEEHSWKLPADAAVEQVSAAGEDMSYYRDGWYFNYNFRFMKYVDARVDAATRVCAISRQPLDWWYDTGSVFIAKAGNEYACVKQKDYTSGYFISSNDLSYIMLNIQ